MCGSGAPTTTMRRNGRFWLRGWWDCWADHSARVLSSRPPSFPARVRSFFLGARSECTGAAVGTTTASTARRRTASGTRRRTGTTSSASALPEFPSGKGVRRAGANGGVARSAGQRTESERAERAETEAAEPVRPGGADGADGTLKQGRDEQGRRSKARSQQEKLD